MAIADSRSRLFIGSLLLVAGAAAVAMNSRVLATVFLDVVVATIQPAPGPPLEPYDFSWGTMHWGRSLLEFMNICAGFFLIAIGQAFVLPPTIRRIGSAGPETPPAFPKLLIVGASVLTLIAAGSFLLIPLTTKSAFGQIAVSGVVDPVSLAEELPVRTSQTFIISLVVAQLLLVLAVFTIPKAGSVGFIRGQKVLSLPSSACLFLFLFAALMALVRLGPVQVFADVGSGRGPADPADLAKQISLAVNIMLVASPLLAASAILAGVAALRPATRG